MSQWRKTKQTGRTDSNQPEIVKALRKIPGVTVQTGMNDILIGYQSKNYWVEIKESSKVSKKTGKVWDSEIKPSQKKLLKEWRGNYKICWNIDQILCLIGIRN